MGVRKLKPTTPGQRHKVIGAFDKRDTKLLVHLIKSLQVHQRSLL